MLFVINLHAIQGERFIFPFPYAYSHKLTLILSFTPEVHQLWNTVCNFVLTKHPQEHEITGA